MGQRPASVQPYVTLESLHETTDYPSAPRIASASVVSASALSGENTGQRTIVDMGCANVDSICYIDISGTPAGASVGCASDMRQFDVLNDPNGKSTYAMMLSVFMTGKLIDIYINSCLSSRPQYPTIWYYNVYN